MKLSHHRSVYLNLLFTIFKGQLPTFLFQKEFYYIGYNLLEQCLSSDDRTASQGPNLLLFHMITPASPTCPIRLYPAARAAQSLRERLRVSCQGQASIGTGDPFNRLL